MIDIAFFGLEEYFPAGARIRGACSGKKLVDGCGGWLNRISRRAPRSTSFGILAFYSHGLEEGIAKNAISLCGAVQIGYALIKIHCADEPSGD